MHTNVLFILGRRQNKLGTRQFILAATVSPTRNGINPEPHVEQSMRTLHTLSVPVSTQLVVLVAVVVVVPAEYKFRDSRNLALYLTHDNGSPAYLLAGFLNTREYDEKECMFSAATTKIHVWNVMYV